MLGLILQAIKFILGISVVGLLHVAVAYVFPVPLNMVHVMFIAIVMILFLYEHGSIIWFAAILFLMLDFPSMYPFGLAVIAGVLATTAMLLLYRHVFTNRSLLAAIALLSIGYAVYRSVYLVYDMLASLTSTKTINFVVELRTYSIELIITLGALIIVYWITSKLSYQLKHTTIQESWFRTLQRK